MSSSIKIGTPRSQQAYRLLAGGESLTARQIGERLGISANAVYRVANELLDIGVIEKSHTYPVTYSASSPPAAMGWFLLSAQRSFKQSFAPNLSTPAAPSPTMSFVRTRRELLTKTNRDTSQAQKTIDFIVSGLEAPAETILSYQKAIARGVRIRVLMQKRSHAKPKELQKWDNLGLQVRYTDDLAVRMFLFDSEIAYMTSYSQTKQDEAFGVRFKYAPMAVLLSDIFEQKWAAS